MDTLAHNQATVDAIVDFMAERFPAFDAADIDAPLIASGAIDSLGVVELMTFIEQRFALNLAELDLSEAHFESIRRLVRFVDARLSRL